ncbi:hypothetical protein [Micromonospora sp. NPDC023737]|uniref:hypothetical protein n=1 Tax=unclassified Micromonospora TaxID=2617518 RepID=UPI0033CC4498
MPDPALGFGYKLQWLAVRDRAADAVAAALNLSRPTPTTWRDAVAAAYAGHAQWLLTPPLDGWTLAASRDVPAPEDDRFAAWLAAISHLLGEVQYFGTHRVIEYHGWGRARGGVVERAFAYLGERGEVLFNVGEPTVEEQELGVGTTYDVDEPSEEDDETSPCPGEETVYLGDRGLALLDVGEATYAEDEPWDDDDETSPWPDEETVLTLAGRWSIDPRKLDGAMVAGHPWITSAESR